MSPGATAGARVKQPRASSNDAVATTPPRVVLLDSLPAAGLIALTEAGFAIDARTGLEGDALADAIASADAVIVRSSTRITRASLARAGRLRVIGRAGVGVDNIDVDAATELGIAVLTAPSGNTVSAAEHAFALMLAAVRRVPAADRSMRAAEWDRKSYQGIELNGKTLGLIGAGLIGGEFARRARAFGMRVIAYDPFLTDDRARTLGFALADLDTVLDSADVISLHVPLTDSTRGMIGADQLRRMKPGAFLINAARGGVIDEAALIDALRDGRLGGAALDVYATEPLPPDDPLRSAPRIVLTPHLGASTVEAQENVAREIAEAVRDALLHDDFSRAVNAPAIGGEAMHRMRPLLDLAERLGRILCAIDGGALQHVDIRYAGQAADVMKPLAAATLVGVLGDVVGRGSVNLVNAAHLARTRGIDIGRTRLAKHANYAEYVEIEATGAAGSIRVAGALLDAAHPRVVRIGEFHVDVWPRGALVILRNRDVPGVIGRVGSLLGDAGVNIAEYHQARLEQGGEALAAISVDGVLSDETLRALREVREVIDAKQVQLD